MQKRKVLQQFVTDGRYVWPRDNPATTEDSRLLHWMLARLMPSDIACRRCTYIDARMETLLTICWECEKVG